MKFFSTRLKRATDRVPNGPSEVQRVFDEALRHHRAGRFDKAAAKYNQTLFLKPDHVDSHNNLGVVLAAQGRLDDAVACYARALVVSPEYAGAHFNLGVALHAQGNCDDAVVHYQRALVLRPDCTETHANLALALSHQGRIDDAMAHYDRAIALNPSNVSAHYNRAETKTFSQGDPDLPVLQALAERGDLPAGMDVFVNFALAKALEDTGDYDRAFEHMRKGNELKRKSIHYHARREAIFFKRISWVFRSSLLNRFEGEGDPSAVPIFVLGMPRSGSTLVEQILASHPEVQAAGERLDLMLAIKAVLNACNQSVGYPEGVPTLYGAALRRIGQFYLRYMPLLADGKTRIVNKLPGNFLYVGLIRLVLPNARIIHTVRHPIDTCVSCYSKLFTSGQYFSYNLSELGRFYRHYVELMAHWRSVLPAGTVLDVAYEDVIEDLESQARRLIHYCGLPWDDRCLGFHATSRVVQTASAMQVRRPLFRSSLQRWRRYESKIDPLLRELGYE